MTSDYVLSHFDAMALWDAVLDTKETTMSITTWADGFGIWHASVPLSGDAAKVARRAILDELRQRGSVSASRVKVEVERVTNHGTVHYREVSP